jgi:ribosomal RNA-processing protein 8
MEAAKKKLQGARFRFLNEKLYTSSSQEAMQYFQANSQDFANYHAGFQTQVAAWPVNPVDVVLQRLQAEIAKNAGQRLCIADLGCGDAKIRSTLGNRAQVHAFDLLADDRRGIVAADMCDVPLADRSVNVVVFSLSLMSTNYVQALVEARRILQPHGLLLIAEVESRMRPRGGPEAFVRQLRDLGFRLLCQSDRRVFLLFEFSLVRPDCPFVPSTSVLSPCFYKKR